MNTQRLTFEQEKQLIEYFKEHPSLWNTKDRDYNNRALRTEKLEVIANRLGLTRKDVYEKYRNLRTTFFREHKRVTRTSGEVAVAGTESTARGQPYISRWRHYNNMYFLAKAHSWQNGADNGGGLARPSSSNMVLSNDDSSSLHNGHDLELVETGAVPAAHHHPSQPGTPSEDLIMMNVAHHEQIDGIINHHQRVYSGNSNSSGTSTSSTISTIPVTGLSVIHAPAINHGSTGSIINLVAATGTRVKLEPPGTPPTTTRPIVTASPVSLTTTATTGTPSTFLINNPIALMPSFLTNHNTVNHGSTSSPAFALAAQRPSTPHLNPILSGNAVVTNKVAPQTVELGNTTTTSNHPQASATMARKSSSSSASSLYVVTAAPSTMKPDGRRLFGQTLSPSSFEPIQRVSGDLVTPVSSQRLQLQAAISMPPQSGIAGRHHHKSPTFIVTNGGGCQGGLVTSTPVNGGAASNSSGTSSGHCTNSSTASSLANLASFPSKLTKVLDYGEMREVIKNVVSEAIVEYEDEEMAFCRSLAASLRTLDRSAKDTAKLELQQVIVRYTNPAYCPDRTCDAAGTESVDTVMTVVADEPAGGDGQPSATTEVVGTEATITTTVLQNYSVAALTAAAASPSPPPVTTTSNAVSTIMTTGSATNGRCTATPVAAAAATEPIVIKLKPDDIDMETKHQPQDTNPTSPERCN